jgi:hypothetical protein
LVFVGYGAEPVKSGLQPGEKITTIFEPVNINGEHAGEPYCLICENGLSPVVMIFARSTSEPLVKLLGKLEEACLKHKDQELGSFVVFLSESEKLRDELAALSKQNGYKRVVLSTFEPGGPDGFHVAGDAEVTVVLYREHEVKGNHTFRRGEFTAASADKVIADLPKILKK